MLHQYCQMVKRLQKHSTSQHLSDIGDGMCILSEAVFTWPVSKSYRYESEVCEVQYLGFRFSALKSKEGSALSPGVRAITVDPAVGSQSLSLCKGDKVCVLCYVRTEMWEVDLCVSLFIFCKKKGTSIYACVSSFSPIMFVHV